MTALYVRFHVWRGFSLFNSKPDFFSYVFRLGFCTVYVCKVCLLNAYRKLRTTIENVVGDHDREGR